LAKTTESAIVMKDDHVPDNQWQNLVTELRNSCDDQHPWGDVDELMVARYLAGECDEAERVSVERAKVIFPDLRECIDLASGALKDFCATPSVAHTVVQNNDEYQGAIPDKPEPVSIGLRIWQLTRSGSVPSWAAAACLLLAIGIGWAVLTRMNNLNSQIASLQTDRANSAKASPASLASNASEKEVRGASAIRGITPLGQEARHTASRFVEFEAAYPGGTRTEYQKVYETSNHGTLLSIPRNIADAPPSLAVDELLDGLSQGNDLVQWAAADALSRTPDGKSRTKTRGAIIDMLKNRADLGRAAANFIVTERIDVGFGNDLSKSASEALANPNKIVRWAGLHYFLVTLHCFEGDNTTPGSPNILNAEFLARLIGQLASMSRQPDEFPLLRKLAVYLLGQFSDSAKPAIDDLLELAEHDEDPLIRRWAAYAIGQIGIVDKAAISRLGRILMTQEKNRGDKFDILVFPVLAYAFGELCHGAGQTGQTTPVVAALIGRLGDENQDISYWSAHALTRINERPTEGSFQFPQPSYQSNPMPTTTSSREQNLRLEIASPEQAVQVGDTGTFNITIFNNGNKTATGLKLVDTFDPGLELKSESRGVIPSPFNKAISDILPNQSLKLGITFTAKQAGQLCHTVEVQGDGDVRASKLACLTAVAATQSPSLDLSIFAIKPLREGGTITPTKEVDVDDKIWFRVEIRNKGEIAARNVKLTCTAAPSLTVDSSDIEHAVGGTGGKDANNYVFTIPSITPGSAGSSFNIICTAKTPVQGACLWGTLLAEGSSQPIQQDACVTIRSQASVASNLQVDVQKNGDPVPINRQIKIIVTVTNAGANTENNVMLLTALPAELRLVGITPGEPKAAVGPGNSGLRFDPFQLAPGETRAFELTFSAVKAGQIGFDAGVTSQAQPTTISDSKTITIFEPQ